MRILLFIFFVVACLNVVIDAQTTTSPDAETTTSPDGMTGSGGGPSTALTTTLKPTTTETTPDPCDVCDMDRVCPKGCGCLTEDHAISLSGICAEPCDYNYLWCSSASAECSPDSTMVEGYKCDCAYNFYDGEDGNCIEGKYFGGEITFLEVTNETDYTAIEGILDGIYDETDLFVKSVILLPENIATMGRAEDVLYHYYYQLIYDKDTNVTPEAINDQFLNSTDCADDPKNVTEGYTVDCAASINTTTSPDVLCKKSHSAPKCIESTAVCAEGEGVMFCKCNDDLLTSYRKPTQDALECIKIPCSASSDCNKPFGWCEINVENELQNYCECMWGFEGGDCNEPWGFVFTVLSGCFGLILIIVLIICICNSTKSKPSKTEAQEDLNLKNPFIDFQPGLVRAKVPNNMYSVSDSFDMRESSNGKNNGAYDHAYDATGPKQTSSFQNDYQTVDAGKDYF